MRPVVALYSTFLQRAVDQVIHDVALPGLPVVFAVDRAGFVPGDGETHQGVFDISLFSAVPGLTMLAPSSRSELTLMLRWAVSVGRPVMIRYPKAVCGPELPELSSPIEEGRGVFVRFLRSEVLFMNVGGMLPQCLGAAHLLNLDGVSADIYNLRFLKPLDESYLLSVLRLYRHVVMVEEAATRGGLGETVNRLLGESATNGVTFVAMGAADRFPGLGSRDQLIAEAGLDAAGIALRARALCERGVLAEARTSPPGPRGPFLQS
jgi:1-deoxy-D-xylulose-5-phosphate synthase